MSGYVDQRQTIAMINMINMIFGGTKMTQIFKNKSKNFDDGANNINKYGFEENGDLNEGKVIEDCASGR